jgi:hypothetical protein
VALETAQIRIFAAIVKVSLNSILKPRAVFPNILIDDPIVIQEPDDDSDEVLPSLSPRIPPVLSKEDKTIGSKMDIEIGSSSVSAAHIVSWEHHTRDPSAPVRQSTRSSQNETHMGAICNAGIIIPGGYSDAI